MVANNPYLIPKVEEVRYLNSEVPTYEEFLKNWKKDKGVSDSYWSEIHSQVKGYGPCSDRDDCSCSCKWSSGCSCVFSYERVGEKNGDWEAIVDKGSIQVKAGWSGIGVGWEDSKSIFRKKDDYEETKYLSSYAGSEFNLGKDGKISAKRKIGFDVANYENEDGFQARVGLNADTGGSIGKDGVEAKLLGFGLSVGKKNEISTPIGGIGCNNQ